MAIWGGWTHDDSDVLSEALVGILAKSGTVPSDTTAIAGHM
jgi:hypothetical protein